MVGAMKEREGKEREDPFYSIVEVNLSRGVRKGRKKIRFS